MLTTAQFTHRTLIVFAIGVAIFVLWQIADVLLLGFGGIVLAVVIRSMAGAIARYLPLSPRWASAVVMLGLLAAVVLVAMFLGDEMAGQLGELRQRLPEAIDKARSWLQGSELGRIALDFASGVSGGALSAAEAVSAASATFSVISDLVVVVLIAMYLSFSPAVYSKGAVALAPEHRQQDAREALRATGSALHHWLLGQAVSMTSVGVLTALGLWLFGIPLAFILGVVAGILEFVPILGPFLAAVPGILVAFTQGPTEALYTAGIYFVVQQLEGALIMPLAQKWAVRLPPALGLLAIAVFGVLFGIPGILLATPLTVVSMVLVKHFYLDRR